MVVKFPGSKAHQSDGKGSLGLSPILRALTLSAAFAIFSSISASATFTHFEARQTHALTLTPNKQRLLAVNSIDARLCVYDVSDAGNNEPVLYAEIPVGLEPVAVAAATNDEAWVVNEVSDTVSIVSLSRRVVETTLNVPDEPSDVVFAGGKAFVSCARNKLIRVFDVASRTEITSIPVQGIEPRALAVNPSGTKVFVAFLMSGNQTTIIPADNLPFPSDPAQPRTALIVPASDSRITYTVLDHDVAQIDVGTHAVDRYFANSGNSIMDVAVHPQTGDIWTANLDPRNLVATEPALKGHVVDHRITRINVNSGTAQSWDLNPGVDYSVLPNPAASARALAEPRAIAFSDQGSKAWVAAFGSDRVACIDATTGEITSQVDLRTGSSSARNMRGPRALALSEDRKHLYVLNKLSNTISVVNTQTSALMAEVPVGSHDPMPTAIKEGRGFLFDARLSGNGTVSCSICHLDMDRDGIAWDLGVPGGATIVKVGKNASAHEEAPRNRVMHPLKGPMTTQTLRGIRDGNPLHWRGDRSNIAEFNPTFHNLLGGEEITAAEMQDMGTYLFSLRLHANPNLLRSGSPPATFEGGFPTIGRDKFGIHNNHCGVCHAGDRGTDNNIDSPGQVNSSQPLMTPHLRTVYQRMDFNPRAGQTSLSGFGILHDGTGYSLPIGHPYTLSELTTPADFANVRAYVLNFPTDTPPAVGVTLTATPENIESIFDEIADMETLSNEGDIGFAVRGLWRGERRSFVYDRDLGVYRSDNSAEPLLTRDDLLLYMDDGDSLEFLGTPPEEAERYATDRDSDGVPDADEKPPELLISNAVPSVRLEWAADPTGWALERSPTPEGTWDSAGGARQKIGPVIRRDETPIDRMFYRLKRTW